MRRKKELSILSNQKRDCNQTRTYDSSRPDKGKKGGGGGGERAAISGSTYTALCVLISETSVCFALLSLVSSETLPAPSEAENFTIFSLFSL